MSSAIHRGEAGFWVSNAARDELLDWLAARLSRMGHSDCAQKVETYKQSLGDGMSMEIDDLGSRVEYPGDFSTLFALDPDHDMQRWPDPQVRDYMTRVLACTRWLAEGRSIPRKDGAWAELRDVQFPNP